MPITSYYLGPDDEIRGNLSAEEISAAYRSGKGLLWVDIDEITPEDGAFLEQTFGFHPLAVEDCVSANIHSPKVDDFGEYLFIIVHGINYAAESEVVETSELNVFLGANFVVSSHNLTMYGVGAVKHSVEANGRVMRQGADFLVHAVIDALIDNIMPAIDRMTEIAEEIEEQVVRNPHPSTLEAVLKLKRSAIRLHRVMAPQREVLNRISRGEFRLVSGDARIFFRDIYDHIVRIEDLNQTVRDMTDNALATYLSSVANRQNEVMKVLSIVAAIFLPLTLLAGVYGMNFENMPELRTQWGYFVVLGVIGAVILTVVLLFWLRGWINWGRRRMLGIGEFVIDKSKLRGYTKHLTKGNPKKS